MATSRFHGKVQRNSVFHTLIEAVGVFRNTQPVRNNRVGSGKGDTMLFNKV